MSIISSSFMIRHEFYVTNVLSRKVKATLLCCHMYVFTSPFNAGGRHGFVTRLLDYNSETDVS